MPKVLRIINRLNLGGPTYNASYLSKYLAPEFETKLIAGIKKDSEASSAFIAQQMGLDISYIDSMHKHINPFNDIRAYFAIKKIIKEFNPDIVHTHASKAGAIGRLAAIHCKVPVILHTFHGHVFHSYFNYIKSNVFIQIERYLAKKTSGIIAISRTQKSELGNMYQICDDKRIYTIPLGFDLKRFSTNQKIKRITFRKLYSVEDDEIAIGIVGRIVPIKNHTLFVHAISFLLKNTTKKIRVFIIGDGEDRDFIESLVQTLNLKQSNKCVVMFTSWIKDIDIAYAGLDIVALSSFNEGTPVSLIEAQAAQKVVVSTQVGGVSDIVERNKTGFLVTTNDPLELGKKLLYLVENAFLIDEMGKNASKSMFEKHNYKRLVQDTRDLYLSLLDKHK